MSQFSLGREILRLEPTGGLALLLQLWMNDLGYSLSQDCPSASELRLRKHEFTATEVVVQAHREWLNPGMGKKRVKRHEK